jgi:RimK family alpha-L-glutamate ligase
MSDSATLVFLGDRLTIEVTVAMTQIQRVVVLSKGRSSLPENKGLITALAARGIEATVCHPDLFAVNAGRNPSLSYDHKPFETTGLVLARTGSGTGSHPATILRTFEALGTRVVNPVNAIRMAMDKVLTMQVAAAHQIPVPRTMVFTARERLVADWAFGYPVIAKVITGSRGNGVFRCNDWGQLKAFTALMRMVDRPFLVQEYIGDRPGCDLRVLVIGDKAIGAMMRRALDGDARANISAGGEGEPFYLTPEIAEISERTARALGLEIAGIDLLFKGQGFVLCEANSSPGFRGFEKYCEIDVAGHIADYLVSQIARSELAITG